MCWVSWTRSLQFSWPTTLARSNSGQTLCLGWTWWIEAHTEILFPRYDISKAGKHGWNISFPSPVSFTECHAALQNWVQAWRWSLRWANRINGHWMNRSAWSKKRRRPPRTDGTHWTPGIGLEDQSGCMVPLCHVMVCYAKKKWSSEINGTIVLTYFCRNSGQYVLVV